VYSSEVKDFLDNKQKYGVGREVFVLLSKAHDIGIGDATTGLACIYITTNSINR